MDLPLLKDDITTFELVLKYGIHSRNRKFGVDDFKSLSQAFGDRLNAPWKGGTLSPKSFILTTFQF
jgi:hypothetical protein